MALDILQISPISIEKEQIDRYSTNFPIFKQDRIKLHVREQLQWQLDNYELNKNLAIVNQNLIGLILSTKGPNFRFNGLIMFWNEFGIHKTSKFGLFVNEIKPIKF